jgi:hypothetical protein
MGDMDRLHYRGGGSESTQFCTMFLVLTVFLIILRLDCVTRQKSAGNSFTVGMLPNRCKQFCKRLIAAWS